MSGIIIKPFVVKGEYAKAVRKTGSTLFGASAPLDFSHNARIAPSIKRHSCIQEEIPN